LSDPKHDETFRVIDRRLFNPDGEVRDEAVSAERKRHEAEAPPSPAPPAATKPEPSAPIPFPSNDSSAHLMDGKAAGMETADPNGPQPSRGLEMLINFVAQNAAMLLGAYPDPRTGQAMLDLDGARELIEMLDGLRDATRGNLAADDDKLLLDVLGSLKLSYVEMTKAAAKAMQDKAKARP
jgi:hypothetical protein